VSPYKGFCCAYRVHTGRSSCSALAYRAIQIHGALAGLVILRERMRLCGVAHRRFTSRLPQAHAKQRGHIDLGCDGASGCDSPGLDAACDVLDCCSGCTWPGPGRRRARDEERYVYIPPKPTKR
jgi:putative component of membrane protein insertase Oxa1/YidC/SpoIIIJ protein YidD